MSQQSVCIKFEELELDEAWDGPGDVGDVGGIGPPPADDELLDDAGDAFAAPGPAVLTLLLLDDDRDRLDELDDGLKTPNTLGKGEVEDDDEDRLLDDDEDRLLDDDEEDELAAAGITGGTNGGTNG